MFQITKSKVRYTKCIHQIYMMYTQYSMLHVHIEYTKNIIHFDKGIQLPKRNDGPELIKKEVNRV